MLRHSNPADEVPVLVEQAEQVTQLSPTLSTFLSNHRKTLVEAITRQIQLVQTRSQALEDGQVTVYDKALLVLTRDGRDPEYAPAIHFFCEQYLGVDGINGHAEMDRIVKQTSELPDLVEEGEDALQIDACSR